LVEAASNPEDIRHPVLFGQQLEEVHQLLVGAGHGPVQALDLLLRGEVRAEEEDLQFALGGDGVGELAQLVADRVELPLLLRDLEEGLGIYAGGLLRHQLLSDPERLVKSTSLSASSTSRRWSSAVRALRVTFSVARTVRSATSLRICC